MSESNSAEKVAAQFEELTETLGVSIEDATLTIEDGVETRTISGADVVEYLTEGEDEDTSEAGEVESEDVTEGDDDTSEAGDVHLEEMEFKDLQRLASEKLAEYPEDQSKTGLVEALDGNISSADDLSEAEKDTSEAGESEEDISEADDITEGELLEAGVKPKNISDVLKYRSKNGVCQKEDCPYGASSEGEAFCASHRGSSKKKQSSSKKTEEKSYENLTEGQKQAARDLISDEEMSLEEAVQMV